MNERQANHKHKQQDKCKGVVFVVDFLTSSLAVATAKTITSPLDRVKMILQTGTLDHQKPNIKRKPHIKEIFRHILKVQGLKGLWKGNWLNIVKTVPSQGLIFSLHSYFVNLFLSENSSQTAKPMKNMVSGALSSGIVITITYPIYFCQNIVSSHVGDKRVARFASFCGCVKETNIRAGKRGLYLGYQASAVSVMINRSLYFGIYEWMKSVKSISTQHPTSKWEAAQIASLCASLVSYPVETIGRMKIMETFKKTPHKSVGYINYTKSLYRTKGITVFFNGCFINSIRSVSGAIMLVTNEELSTLFHGWMNRR